MLRSSTVTFLTLAALLYGCGRQDASLSDRDRSEAIEQVAQSAVAKRGIPGIAIAVLREGKPFAKFTDGVADIAAHTPVTASTPFQLASTTKIFGSAAVLLLVKDGKVHLDDLIGDYLDGLPETWRRVTVRQLLSHTSGLPDITVPGTEVDLIADSFEKAVPLLASKPFQFEPGHGWAYNQTNYALLLRLVERVSGRPFEDFLDDQLFRPLGMSNTFFPSNRRACATNYEPGNGGRLTVRAQLRFARYVHTAGGLCSSLDDLIKWNDALEAGRVLPANLLDQAWTPTKLADGSDAKVGGAVSYGLGWAIDTTPKHRWVGHSGGNSTVFRRYPDDHLTIVVLHNGASDPDAIAALVAKRMTQQTAGGGAQDALWDASSDGDLAAAEAAMQAGADVNALDTRSSKNGRYALNWAAFSGHPNIIRFLLSRGAKIDAQNLTGFTALHHAAEGGSTQAARTLLESGANPSLRNANGETPAEVARRKGNIALAKLIDSAQREGR